MSRDDQNAGLVNSLEYWVEHLWTIFFYIFHPQICSAYYFMNWFRVSENPKFLVPNTSLIGSRLIDFSLNCYCRCFSILLCCANQIHTFWNDGWWGYMDRPHTVWYISIFLNWYYYFFVKMKIREKISSAQLCGCAHTLYKCHHTNNTCTTRFDIFFTYLDFSDGNVSCNLTETVNILKYFTTCYLLFILKK